VLNIQYLENVKNVLNLNMNVSIDWIFSTQGRCFVTQTKQLYYWIVQTTFGPFMNALQLSLK